MHFYNKFNIETLTILLKNPTDEKYNKLHSTPIVAPTKLDTYSICIRT